MGIVIGAVAVVFVLALIIFPGVRGKLKVLVGGFLNIFVEDIAKTPEGAKAVFQQAIEEVQERYNKAGDTLNRFVGEQSSVQKNLNKLYGELKDVESNVSLWSDLAIWPMLPFFQPGVRKSCLKSPRKRDTCERLNLW